MGYIDFVTKEKTQNKTLTPRGERKALKSLLFKTVPGNSSLPEGKLPILAFQAVQMSSTLMKQMNWYHGQANLFETTCFRQSL